MGVCKVACLCVYCVIVGLCSCVVSHKKTSGAGLAGTAFLAGAVGVRTVQEVGRTPGLGV